MTGLLSITGLTAGYDSAPIIHDIDLAVDRGTVVVIIGPNGAGKSTLLRSVFALARIFAGTIHFEGRDITNTATAALVPSGIACVPQTRNVFATLNVRENLEIGSYASPPPDRAGLMSKVLTLFPDLRAKLTRPAGELSGGQRQMLAMGRALMSAPRLLLLDEPTAGLSPLHLEHIFDLIREICAAGTTVVMVEQNARQALRIADMAHVMVNGRNFLSGTGPALLENDAVRRSFLGLSGGTELLA